MSAKGSRWNRTVLQDMGFEFRRRGKAVDAFEYRRLVDFGTPEMEALSVLASRTMETLASTWVKVPENGYGAKYAQTCFCKKMKFTSK